MFKKIIFFILLLFFITDLFTYRLEAQEIAGYIKDVDLVENAVLINDNWYHLSDSSEIFRNGQESSLQAVLPIEGFYQWGKVKTNNEEKVTKLQVYYQVYEGVITELSLSDRVIKVSIYRNNGSLLESEYFYWSNDIINKEEMGLLKEGNHVVFIAAQNILIHLPTL